MLIFLDIDGVLTSANSWKRLEFLEDGFAMFNPGATRALKKILSQTHADILLTTSHKANYSPQEWKRFFNNRDIQVAGINSLPENFTRLSRKEEILSWINIHPVDENFIIIDDDKSLNDLPPSLNEKLILTSGSVGLNDDLANEAIRILKSKQEPVKA